ncbi:hypothetical protein BpHYR1_035719, partial [Brachionus plicatilis]
MALFYRFSLFCVILPFSSSFIYKNRVDLQEDLKIKKISNCKAELNNGSFIDLKSLDNPSDPMSVLNDGREFLYNPCSSIECDKDLSSARALLNNLERERERKNKNKNPARPQKAGVYWRGCYITPSPWENGSRRSG